MNYTSPPTGYYGFSSPSPSPQGTHGFYSGRSGPSPRMHSRHASQDYAYSPRGATYPSPRYSSSGYYATKAGYSSPSGNAEYVSERTRKSHKASRHRQSKWSEPEDRTYPSYRASYGESDEDEYIVQDGYVYVIPAREPTKETQKKHRHHHTRKSHKHRGHATDYIYYSQGQYYDRDGAPVSDPPEIPRFETSTPAPRRPRRASTSTPQPQRPATAAGVRSSARPTSSSKKTAAATAAAAPPPPTPKATEADAKKHMIPPGYSLKNWDPTEEPILLLGSVFDANSLGKWIYDWTVYHHGPATPISEMAGELWLLLIQLAGKVKRSEECMTRIRSLENREMVDDFIESGERLTDKLKKLLKACETPMLRAGKKHGGKEQAQLGKNAGIEFVDSIFGRDRQLSNTEKFMSSIRLWNLRFDANCEDILRRPYA